jgi:osmotically-inducible protein OsmY
MKTMMMVALLLAAAGCDSANGNPSTVDTATPADNTKKNERDRDAAALTPGDQSETEADRTITQKVRQQVVGTDAFSMDAKNVKIITIAGVVTLRGPVKTAQEKTDIGAIAQKTAGVTKVDNQLEVAP